MISPCDGRNTEACGDLGGHTPVAPIEGREVRAHAIGKLTGSRSRLAGQKDHEFLAAETRHQRAFRCVPPEKIGKADENDISGSMAVNVVDALEMVYIAGNDRPIRRVVAKIGNTPVKAAPVQHIRQRVVFRGMQMPVDGDGNLVCEHGKREQEAEYARGKLHVEGIIRLENSLSSIIEPFGVITRSMPIRTSVSSTTREAIATISRSARVTGRFAQARPEKRAAGRRRDRR